MIRHTLLQSVAGMIDATWCYGAFLLASSIGLNLALIASRNDDWPAIQATPYGAEANELLDKGFRIFDKTGAEVEYFDARGFHHRYDDPAPVALIHETAA